MPLPEIDFTAWPVALVAVILLANLFKEPLARAFPTLFRAYVDKAKFEAEERARMAERDAERQQAYYESDRQDDIAILQAMVHLQTEAIRQNEKLLDFIINRLDTQLAEIGQTVLAELRSIRGDLSDMTARWIAAGSEINKSSTQHQLTRIELARLVDRFEAVEKQLIILTGEAE